MPALAAPPGALLGQFLVAVNGFILHDNETQLANYLILEPPFNPQYQQMISELRKLYPRGNEEALEGICEKALTCTKEDEDGFGGWSSLIKFMAQYFVYLRDVDISPARYLVTYEALSELQTRANSALSHTNLGHLLIPTVVACARLISRLAIGLDKQPALIAHLKSGSAGAEDGGVRETLPERAANLIRQAFVTCLNDRSSSIDPVTGLPERKKRGIYIIANICLKILFQCNKTRNATQIFENIYALSPPLSAYPKRDRVTYLYYLGRFCLQSSHFPRARAALAAAYDISPISDATVSQRRLILIHLIASNILCGRFPTAELLLSRREATGLAAHFQPVCQAIRAGDWAALRAHLRDGHPEGHDVWLRRWRLLLPLRNRGEVLCWRTLVRRTWVIAGQKANTETKAAAMVGLETILAAWRVVEKKARLLGVGGEKDYVDPDLEGAEGESGADEGGGASLREIEVIVGGLIDQGFLNGYISHHRAKFVIMGAKQKGGDALAAGFPRVSDVISRKTTDEVPGWKKDDGRTGGGFGPGQVVRLSGARAVGER